MCFRPRLPEMEESRVGTRAMASALALALVFLEAVAADSQGEAQALFALRRRLRDPLNVLQSWDPTLVSPCTWFHVTCDSQSRVTRLDLGNARLSGTLAPELGTLTHLEYLELYKNRITGSIPKEFGNLQSLISLDLYQNNLIGTIPSSLSNLKALRFLRLNGNRLIGRIPPQLSTITSLKILDVSNNDLCGGIPTGGSFAKFSLESFRNNPRLNVASLSFALQLEDNSNSTTT